MHAEVSAYCLDHVSDGDLHASTRLLVGRSNQVLAALLAHLAELEARGIHRARACASLCSYCIYELRMSEDAASRRARAAKIARRFPILFQQIAAGEIHLSGVLILGPHLTAENHIEVLALAKHRTNREIAKLVRRLNPLPAVPALVEPLGPAPRVFVATGNRTWNQMTTASSQGVRELEPGDRPKDWTEDQEWNEGEERATSSPTDVVGRGSDDCSQGHGDWGNDRGGNDRGGNDRVDNVDGHTGADHSSHADAATCSEQEGERWLEPQRYKVQFTATQEYVDLLEEAKDLLSHAVPNRSLEQVHLRAMRALVIELKKRKYGATHRPRGTAMEAPSGETGRKTSDDPRQELTCNADARAGAHPRGAKSGIAATTPRQSGETTPRQSGGNTALGRDATKIPLQRGRYVPRAVRRALWERDGGRCTYVDATGQRCRETGFLELDHIDPHARGGPPTVPNLRLRCRAHNALAAEAAFGRDYIARMNGTALPEALIPLSADF